MPISVPMCADTGAGKQNQETKSEVQDCLFPYDSHARSFSKFLENHHLFLISVAGFQSNIHRDLR
jgi:hypothetical protein